jgi:Mn2+/Fe2+ NRAMP family transporter
MKEWERWLLRVGFFAAALTGVAYGALRYFGRVQGEFGWEPHRWEGFLQHAHVVLTPCLVLALGAGLRGHVSGMLRKHVTRGRMSGLVLLGVAAPMVFGGYALQVVTDGDVRRAVAWFHGVASGAFILFYVAHWLKGLFSAGDQG